MILPNFINFLYTRDKSTFKYIDTSGATKTCANSLEISRLYGDGSNIGLNSNYKIGIDGLCNLTGGSSGGIALYLGKGTTKPTENDYTLEDPISVSDLPITIGHVDMQTAIDKFMIVSIIVENTTTENITVSEMGLFAASHYSGNTVLMIAREVLDTPVIIEPGVARIFTMTIK